MDHDQEPNGGGEDLAHMPPSASLGTQAQDFSTSAVSSERSPRIPSGAYRESGMRWMERQEARSLREALEDMDMRDEAKLQVAAQDEASELVLQHQKDGSTAKSPYQPYNYRAHLEKGAHARSQSVGWHSVDGHNPGKRSVSDGSNSSNNSKRSPGSQCPANISFDTFKRTAESDAGASRGHVQWDSPQKRAYMSLISAGSPINISGRRRSSGPRARHPSGGLFRNPDDKIYEEPDNTTITATVAGSHTSKIPGPLMKKSRNAVPDSSTLRQRWERSRVSSDEVKPRFHRSEIHKNPPSQSRDPSYTRNETPQTPVHTSQIQSDQDSRSTREGREVRSDDIRAATSKPMRDRSPKLPSPTVISDRPGRPIVSFEQDWKPKHTDDREDAPPRQTLGIPARLRRKPPIPASTASAPIVPTINLPEVPSININDEPAHEVPSVPAIAVSETVVPTVGLSDDPHIKRSLPTPSHQPPPTAAKRPLPRHSATTPVHSSKFHWSPAPRRATAQCAACALPIEGRIVSAASQRFHPHCFICHHCATALECVAFYPEPDSFRTARLARIEARTNANYVEFAEEKPGETAVDDGDESLRFYCHLDYHELFSPRCRSCKTPIETEVVLACGGSWHVGHFFCAECGDPFNRETPFVERDGYAWCVGCHAGRFSGKCRGCRKPVVDGGVRALGGEWHEMCFCCAVSVPYISSLVCSVRESNNAGRNAVGSSRMADSSLEKKARSLSV
ncbi:hypothetical protein MMC21_001453 [Puttea exsequens]|nr:hypothetical protein [Puttea exsequens]